MHERIPPRRVQQLCRTSLPARDSAASAVPPHARRPQQSLCFPHEEGVRRLRDAREICVSAPPDCISVSPREAWPASRCGHVSARPLHAIHARAQEDTAARMLPHPADEPSCRAPICLFTQFSEQGQAVCLPTAPTAPTARCSSWRSRSLSRCCLAYRSIPHALPQRAVRHEDAADVNRDPDAWAPLQINHASTP